jgi:F0F1-type ATP synthase assembly protein I
MQPPKKDPSEKRPSGPPAWLRSGTKMAPAAEAAWEAVLAIGLALLIGHYLDRWFRTDPWCFFALLVLGLATAFKRLLGIAKRASQEPPRDEN